MKIGPLLFGILALFVAVPAVAQDDAGQARQAYERAIEDTKNAITADPQDALVKSDIALERAQALEPREAAIGRATALWLKIEAHLWLNQLDQAERHLAPALGLARRYAPKDKLLGDLMRSKGAISGLRGDVQHALRDYLSAFRIYRTAGEERGQAITLQDIGQIYWEAGDYRRMLGYLDQAQQIYNGDPGFSLTTHNNRGEALRALGQGKEAEAEYEAALAAARELDSALLETRIRSNIALAQLDQGKLEEAGRSARRALATGASPEAAEWLPFVYGVLAKIDAARGEDEKAARLLERAFANVDLSRTELVFKEFHEAGAQVFERLDQPELALAHLKAFQRLDGQARDLTSTASSQLLAARFDFANQNLRISQLKQGQLERDVKIERQRVEFRTTLFSGLAVAGAIVMVLITLAFFSIRRSRNEVRAANLELTSTNQALEKALKAKGDLLAMTSHELRTPLNGILGMAQVMLARPELDPQSRDQVELVRGAGETMRALVDDILDVAKMETGEVSVQVEPTNLRTILDDAARLWRSEAQTKGLDLHADCAATPPLMQTDGGKVRQIVFNLLSNAIKFTPEGSVRLTTEISADGARIAIIVEDTGIGIAQDQQELVFDAFHQVDSAMTRQFSGTGLGLAICRSLANALGGSITLSSVLGEGSKFTLVLPYAPAESATQEPRSAELGAAKVGLVDTNPMRRSTMRGLIAPHVGSVREADDAKAATLLMQIELDILVVDASSVTSKPEQRLAALGELLAAAKLSAIPVIVMLAPDEHLTVAAVAALEPASMLLKPLRGSQLVGALRQIEIGRAPTPLQQVA